MGGCFPSAGLERSSTYIVKSKTKKQTNPKPMQNRVCGLLLSRETTPGTCTCLLICTLDISVLVPEEHKPGWLPETELGVLQKGDRRVRIRERIPYKYCGILSISFHVTMFSCFFFLKNVNSLVGEREIPEGCAPKCQPCLSLGGRCELGVTLIFSFILRWIF